MGISYSDIENMTQRLHRLDDVATTIVYWVLYVKPGENSNDTILLGEQLTTDLREHRKRWPRVFKST